MRARARARVWPFLTCQGSELFLYNGAKSNASERRRGERIVADMQKERQGDGAAGGAAIPAITIHRLDTDPMNAAFWEAIGGYIDVTRWVQGAWVHANRHMVGGAWVHANAASRR